MELFAYIDETASDNTSDPNAPPGIQLVGAGALFTEAPVGKEVIDEAIASLRSNPDLARYPKSNHNIEKEIFHASSDSPLSKASFISAISSNINGLFHSYLTDLDSERELCMQRSIEDIYRTSSRINLGAIDGLAITKLNIFVEGRKKFNQVHVDEWIERCYNNIDLYALDEIEKPQFYPDIHLNIVDKNCTGIQVCDYLLWMHLRSVKHSDNKWFDILNSNCCNLHNKSRAEYRAVYIMNKFNEEVSSYPVTFTLDVNRIDFESSVKQIQCVVDYLCKIIDSISHEHIKYLLLEYEKDKSTVSHERCYLMCKIYLRSFDTLSIPSLCQAATKSDYVNLVNAKHIAASALRGGSIQQTRELDKMCYLIRSTPRG